MKKTDFEKHLSDVLNMPASETGVILEKIINTMVDLVRDGEDVPFGKVGKFKYVDVKERSGVMNGKKWVKPAHKTIKFTLTKFGKEL